MAHDRPLVSEVADSHVGNLGSEELLELVSHVVVDDEAFVMQL